MASAEPMDGNLTVALATWVFLLHAAGIQADDDAVRALCEKVKGAENEEEGDAAGLELVQAMSERLQGQDTPDRVLELAAGLFGDRAVAEMGEGNRQDRTHRIRKYQFGRQLPWLARIWERSHDGRVAPSWLLIEQVTDQVLAMDPNPWNDIDEERTLPVADFQVLWELDGCTSVHIR